jgi:hypothetical protein
VSTLFTDSLSLSTVPESFPQARVYPDTRTPPTIGRDVAPAQQQASAGKRDSCPEIIEKQKSPFFLRTGLSLITEFFNIRIPDRFCPTISETQRDYNNQAFFVPEGFGYNFLI